MADNTWNFACNNCKDSDAVTPNSRGGVFGLWRSPSPKIPPSGADYPWIDTFTAIFSFFHRSGFSEAAGNTHGIFTIGKKNDAESSISIKVHEDPMKLHIQAYDRLASAFRLQVDLGDEDGVNWLSSDKWYQIGLSLSPVAFSYAVNGSVSPKQTITTNAPGVLSFDGGQRAVWNNPDGNNPNDNWVAYQQNYSTLIHGASLWDDNYLDFNSATVRNRIWDSNGDFKNPGENGSLWLGDTYGATIPDIYLRDGGARHDGGAYNLVANPGGGLFGQGGGGSGVVNAPGGFRKQYE
ncbi:MAG: hypothetical protein V3V74_00390 [Nitrosomonadaceae bacterium]